MSYISLFVATAWDVFFTYKDNLYKGKSVAEISSDIKDQLQDLITQHKRTFPDISEMIRELKLTQLRTTNFKECEEKDQFIKKFTNIFHNKLEKK